MKRALLLSAAGLLLGAAAKPAASGLRDDLGRLSRGLAEPASRAEEDADPDEVSREELEALRGFRAGTAYDARLEPSLGKLEQLFRELPRKPYARGLAADLALALAGEVGDAAQSRESDADALARLERGLALPAAVADDSGAGDLSFFPVDVPLPEYKKLSRVKVFLMKHRTDKPANLRVTTPDELVGGRRDVESGVEVVGVVTHTHRFLGDGDFTFDFGNGLHMEIPPESRSVLTPKVGDRVRVRGWSYYDLFHKAEREFDPDDPVVGARRITLWEIHPVQSVVVLSEARAR